MRPFRTTTPFVQRCLTVRWPAERLEGYAIRYTHSHWALNDATRSVGARR